jgi:transposase
LKNRSACKNVVITLLVPPREVIGWTLDAASQHTPARALPMYGTELRWLAIFKLFTLIIPLKTVSEHLCIGVSTLKRWAARYEETGDVYKRSGQSGRKKKMSSAEELRLVEHVLDSPTTTLSKQHAQLILSSGTVVSLATLCRVLHKHGLTRQRVCASTDYPCRARV